jgi:N-acetylneuraminate lyase
MLHSLLHAGCDGVYVAGTTGEGLLLPQSERKALVETLSRCLTPGKRLLVHVGAATVKDALVLAEHAARHGAHAISSLPPKGDTVLIAGYYAELAAHSSLPLILYYFPKAAPHAFADPNQLFDICNLPNVLGVKFTDFNFYLMQRLIKRGNLVFNGYDEALAAGLLMGAQGGIGSTYNIMPEAYLALYRAALAGDWEKARRWQTQVNDVITTLLGYPFFPALRAIMKKKGFDCGPMMSGDKPLSEAQCLSLFADLDRNVSREMAQLLGLGTEGRPLHPR